MNFYLLAERYGQCMRQRLEVKTQVSSPQNDRPINITYEVSMKPGFGTLSPHLKSCPTYNLSFMSLEQGMFMTIGLQDDSAQQEQTATHM